MAVLQIEISDRLIHQYGLESIYTKIKQMLDLQELRLMAIEFNEQLKAQGLDHDQMFKESRKIAWQKFKAERLKDVLP